MTPSQQTLDALYRQYHRQIHAYLSRMTGDAQEAEDLTQEVFLKAYRQLPRPRSPGNQRSWLFQMATCVCFDHYRRRSRRVREESVPDDAQFASIVDPFEQSQSAAAVVASLRRLAARHRAALILKDVHGFKHAEIAGVMGISEGAAQILLHRARDKFRHAYSEVLTGISKGCPFADRVAVDLVGGTLTRVQRRDIHKHIETCPECRDRLAGRSLPVGALGFLLPPPPTPAPEAPLLPWAAAPSVVTPTLAMDGADLPGVLSRVLTLLAPKAAAVTLGAALTLGGPLAAEHVVSRTPSDVDTGIGAAEQAGPSSEFESSDSRDVRDGVRGGAEARVSAFEAEQGDPTPDEWRTWRNQRPPTPDASSPQETADAGRGTPPAREDPIGMRQGRDDDGADLHLGPGPAPTDAGGPNADAPASPAGGQPEGGGREPTSAGSVGNGGDTGGPGYDPGGHAGDASGGVSSGGDATTADATPIAGPDAPGGLSNGDPSGTQGSPPTGSLTGPTGDGRTGQDGTRG